MNLELFRLKELPFRLSPDPQFLYLSKHHARAKAYMESTVWFTDGFVVLTGEIGSGKTTLIETFLQGLDKDVTLAQRLPAERAGAVRLLAVSHAQGRAARHAEPVPGRAVRRRAQAPAHRRRGTEPVAPRARG